MVWIGFNLLRNSRIISEFGISPIFLSEIRGVLDELGIIDTDIRVYYTQLIQRVDIAYMEYTRSQQKK